MKKLLLVMNPYAGTRKCNPVLADVIYLFNCRDFEVTVHMTAGPGDGARIVRERAEGYDLIVCAGGDGTFNETLTGLRLAGLDIPVGYIPCGSTNDFAASLHLPTSILPAAKAIMNGTPVRYDMGRFGDRYFSYVASFGAFTRTSYSTPQSVKNALGHLAYVLEGAKELFNIPKLHLRFDTDQGTFEDDYIFGAVSNSTSVGGILNLDPSIVDMQDGKFELMLVRPPKNPAELGNLISALRNQRYVSPMLTFKTVQSLSVTCPADMSWTLDGEEARTDGHVEIENLHHSFRLMQDTRLQV